MASDIMKTLLEADAGTPAPAKSGLIAKLAEPGDAATPAPGHIVPKLVSVQPIVGGAEKQQGPVTVVMLTPYTATARDVTGLIKALAKVDKSVGKVGKVLFEGSFEIGRKLPRIAAKYTFVSCVRDTPQHLRAYRHLGGSGRHKNPQEEVRERLDDEDRLLRRDEEDALADMLGMATDQVVMVIMPGSHRMSLAESYGNANGIAVELTAPQANLAYADDIEVPLRPVNLLVLTPDTYTDVRALLIVQGHLANLGRVIGKIIHTPSMAMEVIASAAPGPLLVEIDEQQALGNVLSVFNHDPDYLMVAGNTTLGVAALSIAGLRGIPCVELP